jgi:hypothetical protein
MDEKLKRPKRYNESQLAKAGVELVDKLAGLLSCKQCGYAWMVNVGGRGPLPRGYWKCPKGCNEDAE